MHRLLFVRMGCAARSIRDWLRISDQRPAGGSPLPAGFVEARDEQTSPNLMCDVLGWLQPGRETSPRVFDLRRASLICRSDTQPPLRPLRHCLSGDSPPARTSTQVATKIYSLTVLIDMSALAPRSRHTNPNPHADDDSENDAARTIAVPASSRGGLTIWKPAIDLG